MTIKNASKLFPQKWPFKFFPLSGCRSILGANLACKNDNWYVSLENPLSWKIWWDWLYVQYQAQRSLGPALNVTFKDQKKVCRGIETRRPANLFFSFKLYNLHRYLSFLFLPDKVIDTSQSRGETVNSADKSLLLLTWMAYFSTF